jgi:group II intron reverse transcriptase/maturase
MPRPKDKPFAIPKQLVWEAYRRVAANKGAPGVDGQALDEFEADLADNLYKIWNRMSSGSYFPPPVRAVEVPKPHGDGVRVLGVPTIADRIAQSVVATFLEPRVEPKFHRDSYGYRPRKAALEAVGVCRQRCWEFDWMIDLDVQKFFDEVPWDLVVKAVRAVTDARWVLLYVKRWLAAPLQHPDGTLVERDKGTPQGSAVSPVLANLFMHYAFDLWMARSHPGCPFERYADDAVVHCKQAAGRACACRDRRANGGGGAAASPRQDEDRLLQGRQSSGGARAHLVYLPRVYLPGTGGDQQQEWAALQLVLARDQPRGAQGQKRPAPRTADPQAHQPVAK